MDGEEGGDRYVGVNGEGRGREDDVPEQLTNELPKVDPLLRDEVER